MKLCPDTKLGERQDECRAKYLTLGPGHTVTSQSNRISAGEFVQ